MFRVARITSVRILAESVERPAGFDLAAFWRQWSAEFEASRPRLPVTLRTSPQALAAFGEVFGQAAGPALAAALPPDREGWRVVTLTFEHEQAAVGRLAGFADQVEVLTPPSVRAGLVAAARHILQATMRQTAERPRGGLSDARARASTEREGGANRWRNMIMVVRRSSR